MKNPTELVYPKELPDDLKLLLQEHKTPADDPVIALLAWHWLRINKSSDIIGERAAELKKMLDEGRELAQDHRLRLEALFDERLKNLREWIKTLETLNGHLEKLSAVLSEKPLAVSKQIQEDLAKPIAASVQSVRQLTLNVGGLNDEVEKSRQRIHRSQIITVFLSGYSTAALIIAWIFCHIFSH